MKVRQHRLTTCAHTNTKTKRPKHKRRVKNRLRVATNFPLNTPPNGEPPPYNCRDLTTSRHDANCNPQHMSQTITSKPRPILYNYEKHPLFLYRAQHNTFLIYQTVLWFALVSERFKQMSHPTHYVKSRYPLFNCVGRLATNRPRNTKTNHSNINNNNKTKPRAQESAVRHSMATAARVSSLFSFGLFCA